MRDTLEGWGEEDAPKVSRIIWMATYSFSFGQVCVI